MTHVAFSPLNTDEDALLLFAPGELLGCATVDAVQGEASSRLSCGSCALCTGDIEVYFFVTAFSVRCAGWIPAGPVNERLPGDWTRLQTAR